MSNFDSQVRSLPVAVEKLSRRAMAQTLLSAAAAGFALPAISADHAVWHYLAGLSETVDAQLASAHWKPLFLTVAQEESLRALAEVMLPGSSKAFVSRFIDLILCVESEVSQHKFIGSLQAVDQECAARRGKPFSQVTAQDQQALLSYLSSAPASEDPASRVRGHFENLKEWIVGAYYSSEIGMRELGWTPDRVFATFPSCSHAEGHS